MTATVDFIFDLVLIVTKFYNSNLVLVKYFSVTILQFTLSKSEAADLNAESLLQTVVTDFISKKLCSR